MYAPDVVVEEVTQLWVVPGVKLNGNALADAAVAHVLAAVAHHIVAAWVAVHHKGKAVGTVHGAGLEKRTAGEHRCVNNNNTHTQHTLNTSRQASQVPGDAVC